MIQETQTKSWQPRVKASADGYNHTEDSGNDKPFFTLLRQQGMTVDFLNICFKNGKELALPTAGIMQMEYLPEQQSILISFRLSNLMIKGRNLINLYKHLVRLKVLEIRDYPKEPDKDFGVKDLFITKIEHETEIS